MLRGRPQPRAGRAKSAMNAPTTPPAVPPWPRGRFRSSDSRTAAAMNCARAWAAAAADARAPAQLSHLHERAQQGTECRVLRIPIQAGFNRSACHDQVAALGQQPGQDVVGTRGHDRITRLRASTARYCSALIAPSVLFMMSATSAMLCSSMKRSVITCACSSVS